MLECCCYCYSRAHSLSSNYIYITLESGDQPKSCLILNVVLCMTSRVSSEPKPEGIQVFPRPPWLPSSLLLFSTHLTHSTQMQEELLFECMTLPFGDWRTGCREKQVYLEAVYQFSQSPVSSGMHQSLDCFVSQGTVSWRLSPDPCLELPRRRWFPDHLCFLSFPRGETGLLLSTALLTGGSPSGDVATLAEWLCE